MILALGRWGSEVPFRSGEAQFGVDAVVLALMTLLDPSAADHLRATYELRLGGQRFLLRVSDGLTVERVTGATGAGLTLESDPATLAAVRWHGRAVADVEGSGALVSPRPRHTKGCLASWPASPLRKYTLHHADLRGTRGTCVAGYANRAGSA